MSDDRHLADIEQLVAEFKRSGLRELQARSGDFEIFLSLDPDAEGLSGGGSGGGGSGGGVQTQVARAAPAAAPVAAAAPPPVAASAPVVLELPEGGVVVCAPYLGTFYRSPKPGSPPYVEIGSVVSAESELCLVEVMKLFTAVRAGVAGTIAQVLASDGELVTTDQPLFVVVPG